MYREEGRIRLQPANSTMEPIYVSAENIEVHGKVVGVLRDTV
ncbi:MAG: S24 family peptidase [Dehalococcoidia bacterium]|nr:S24 family peptidase [Dehalococcoidia bacterium]